jgi:hypothetical protein
VTALVPQAWHSCRDLLDASALSLAVDTSTAVDRLTSFKHAPSQRRACQTSMDAGGGMSHHRLARPNSLDPFPFQARNALRHHDGVQDAAKHDAPPGHAFLYVASSSQPRTSVSTSHHGPPSDAIPSHLHTRNHLPLLHTSSQHTPPATEPRQVPSSRLPAAHPRCTPGIVCLLTLRASGLLARSSCSGWSPVQAFSSPTSTLPLGMNLPDLCIEPPSTG